MNSIKSEITVNFGDMPVYMGCVESDPQNDQFCLMRWGLDNKGLLRVLEPPALNLVYPEQHSDPFPSKTWMDHHRDFSRHVIQGLVSGTVLEVGAAHGILAGMVQEKLPGIDWTIIEPNPVIIPGVEAEIISGWFPADLPPSPRVWSNIVASHVLEHAVDPYNFLRDCFNYLEIGGSLVLSWPDMLAMASRTDLNMMNFEHLTFLPITTVESMLKNIGFEILAIEKFRGHSIFISASKNSDSMLEESYLESESSSHDAIALEYKTELMKRVACFNLEINAHEKDVWLFGAHIFSQFLIVGGLDTARVRGLLDNAPTKQGKRLYGTDFLVFNPSDLRFERPGLILIAAALYEDEIIAQLRELNLKGFEILSSQHGKIFL